MYGCEWTFMQELFTGDSVDTAGPVSTAQNSRRNIKSCHFLTREKGF